MSRPFRFLAAAHTSILLIPVASPPSQGLFKAPIRLAISQIAISRRILMIITTTDQVEGRRVIDYLGVVTGEAIIGVNVFRDFFAGIRDIVGGRSGGYQNALRDAREHAMADMQDAAKRLGADAVVGIDLDYEVLGKENGMLMVSINGTAVRLG
jgi:uncharacterized protein YbjQ (UPF0145 family)